MKQQTTPWFSYLAQPKRKGWYECSCGDKHYWFKKEWYWEPSGTPILLSTFAGNNKWRGLTKEAK